MTATAKPGPSGCTCLRLRKASRGVSQIYDRHLEPTGLTITQYGLLGHLESHDGIGLGELAEMLIMDPTTLTRNLRPLARQGLVRLKSDPKDRRARRLHLTAKGRKAHAEAGPAWLAAQRHIEKLLGRAEARTLHAALDCALDRLTA